MIADDKLNEQSRLKLQENASRIERERRNMAARWGLGRIGFAKELILEPPAGEVQIPKAALRERNCMSCSYRFMSSGPGHRLCDKCRRRAEGFDCL